MPDYTVLLIDYEPRSIRTLTQTLQGAGYRVEIAEDGLEGIKAFERLQPDLTLVEAMLPKKHGFEVCQELKSTPHGATTPVIVITAVYKGRKYRSQALHYYKADEYIEKPIAPDNLLATLNRLLQRAENLVGGAPATQPASVPKPESPATPEAIPVAAPRQAPRVAPTPAPAAPAGPDRARVAPTPAPVAPIEPNRDQVPQPVPAADPAPVARGRAEASPGTPPKAPPEPVAPAAAPRPEEKPVSADTEAEIDERVDSLFS